MQLTNKTTGVGIVFALVALCAVAYFVSRPPQTPRIVQTTDTASGPTDGNVPALTRDPFADAAQPEAFSGTDGRSPTPSMPAPSATSSSDFVAAPGQPLTSQMGAGAQAPPPVLNGRNPDPAPGARPSTAPTLAVNNGSRPLTPEISGSLPSLPAPAGFEPGSTTSSSVAVMPTPGTNPAASSASNPNGVNPAAPSAPRITLRAIMEVEGKKTAFISVDGKPSRGYRVGHLITDTVKLVAIENETIVLKGETKRATYSVGIDGVLP
jgi:hypothetical protein